MQKNISLFLITASLLGISNSTFAVTQTCNDVEWYELYECRVKSVCLTEPEKRIYDTQKDEREYLELEPNDSTYLSLNQKKYRENMNGIYKCALIQVQLNALNRLDNLEKDPDIKNKINTKIQQRSANLEQRKWECLHIDDETVYNKITVLNQTTYEICKYINYLDYLDNYTDSLSNTASGEEEQTAVAISQKQARVKQDIQDEFDHVTKVFPLAYTAYSQYENNIMLHFVLELIREDFIIFKKRLHSILWPISQLVYKANNSMTK